MDVTGAEWRKASRSADQGNCVEIAPLWRRARRSAEQGECVEVAVWETGSHRA